MPIVDRPLTVLTCTGPFYPSPPPFPTFAPPADFDATVPLVAPEPEKDVNDKKEPDDAL